MNTSAIVMMVVAIALVWGGLIASILFMRANPQVDSVEDPDLDPEDPEDDDRVRLPRPTRDL